MTAIGSALLTGCGSGSAGDLPPAAGPAPSPPLSAPPAGEPISAGVPPAAPAPLLDGGRVVLRLRPRERTLEARDRRTGRLLGSIPVGTGPTRVVTDGENLAYVTDTANDGLLTVRLTPRFEVTRRMHVPGAPYAVALDRRRSRLWITATATNELQEAAAGPKPRAVRRVPTVRGPIAVAVEESSGRVTVTGRDGQRRRLDAP